MKLLLLIPLVILLGLLMVSIFFLQPLAQAECTAKYGPGWTVITKGNWFCVNSQGDLKDL